jgi:hypothetical protein
MADADFSELNNSIRELASDVRDLSNTVSNSKALDESSIAALSEALANAVRGINNTTNATKSASDTFADLGKEIRDLEGKLGTLKDIDISSRVTQLQSELGKMTEGIKKSQEKIAELSAKSFLRPTERQSLADTQASIAGREAAIAAKQQELADIQALAPLQQQLAEKQKEQASLMMDLENEAYEMHKAYTTKQIDNTKKLILAEEAKIVSDMKKLASSSIPDLITQQLSGGNEIVRTKMQIVFSAMTKVFEEAMKIFSEGIRKASTLGISAAEGVTTEIGNRFQAFVSAFSFDASKMVTPEQIASAQKAFVDASIGVREGRVISTEGSAEFAKTLKTGFKSEFELTSESLRALAVTGLTTGQDIESFRQASGRASLSSGQFAQIVNKNALSFLLFGNSVAKAAADADRLGISFSSVQKGQESFVTNLDGGIDTIAQLNQLGAGIDFGTLVQLSEFGTPDQIMNYLKTTVPPDLMKGASVRSLFGQLFPGIDAEALLRMNQVGSTLDTIEGQMTKGGEASANNFGASVAQFGNIIKSTFGGLINAITTLGIGIVAISTASGTNTLATLQNTLATHQNTAAKLGLPVASPIGGAATGAGMMGTLGKGLGAAMVGVGGGTALGTAMGASTGASLTASTIGTILGAVLGSFVGSPFIGAMIGGNLGGLAAGGLSGLSSDADVTIPSGYGPYGLTDFSTNQSMAFSSGDRILAMRKPEGSISAKSNNEKIDKLAASIDRLVSKDVPIEVNGQVQMVPAVKMMSGIKFRNDALLV